MASEDREALAKNFLKEEISHSNVLLISPNTYEMPTPGPEIKVVVATRTYFFQEHLEEAKKQLTQLCQVSKKIQVYFMVCIANIQMLNALVDHCPSLRVVSAVCVTDSEKFKASMKKNCSKSYYDLLNEDFITIKVFIRFQKYFYKTFKKQIKMSLISSSTN
jgi:hypothetical protein